MTPPEISTQRLLLRPLAAGDLDAPAAIYAISQQEWLAGRSG